MITLTPKDAKVIAGMLKGYRQMIMEMPNASKEIDDLLDAEAAQATKLRNMLLEGVSA